MPEKMNVQPTIPGFFPLQARVSSKPSKAPGRYRYMGESDDSRGQDAAVPGHDEADAGVIEKDTDRMLEAKTRSSSQPQTVGGSTRGRVRKTSRIPFKIRGNRAT